LNETFADKFSFNHSEKHCETKYQSTKKGCV